jgi:hypothetical protein
MFWLDWTEQHIADAEATRIDFLLQYVANGLK